MSARIFRGCLTVLFVLCATQVSRAEIAVATSLEWLSCSAEAIVIGKISKLTATPGPGEVTYEDCVVDVSEVLKGDLKDKQLEFTLRRLGDSPTAQPLLQSKDGVLLFVSKSKDHGLEHHLDGKWVPTGRDSAVSIIDLVAPKDVYSKEMRTVGGIDELLKIVGEWAKSPVRQSLWLEVPFDSAIHAKLYGGSTCYLVAPAEEKYRAGFMKLARSDKPYERAKAAGELSKFPGEETEAVLRQLLKDDSEQVWCDAQDHISSVKFAVRAAAWQSLKELGKPAADMALERQATAEEQRALREKCWKGSFAAALKEGWAISVADGLSRPLDGRDRTIVVVTCRREKQQATFTLVPKEWLGGDAGEKDQTYLGINGPNSQGGRRFYLQGELPGDVTKAVVAYFGLQK